MDPKITDAQLEALDREVGKLITKAGEDGSSGYGRKAESKERIERILRRVRLEVRIAEESAKASASKRGE